ncbi:phosphoribosylanthranilate isomerase [Marivirga sp. S37H4]|uniref:phosphoribosylanthranilate isomerase n=1 Tax=Marivirga aurantiaca TaxID=2802615 RepID=A0A935C7E7_9BACT|nr:phosphoribosylanthranilate isomerase [Marivirga aurantiaca]MBK6264327.1 phosphoribosylanthranilate isomerase [Marivirga aurantiaca]
MALKTFVKISEVNNLSDARYCAGMTVDLMGFSLVESSLSYVNPANFMELTGWVSGVDFVGEFGDASEEEIKKSLPEYEIHYIQTDNPAILPQLTDIPQKLILRFNVDVIQDANKITEIMEKSSGLATYFLFESVKGIHYKEHILNQVLDWAKDFPIILGFNVSEENVLQLTQENAIKGISLKGGEEIRPGFKDFDELADILETLEIDDTIE